MDLINKLNHLKNEQKMTLKKLSKLSGIHQNTISNWLYLGFEPTLNNFNKVLNVLGYELAIMKIDNPCQ